MSSRPYCDRFPEYFTPSRLPRVQGLGNVGDQIVRMLDADRQPDRGVEDPDLLSHIGRYSGMRHARRKAGEGFRPAQADGELEYLQGVEEFERGGLAADDVERNRGAGAGALAPEETAGRRVLVEVTEVMDLHRLNMVT